MADCSGLRERVKEEPGAKDESEGLQKQEEETPEDPNHSSTSSALHHYVCCVSGVGARGVARPSPRERGRARLGEMEGEGK